MEKQRNFLGLTGHFLMSIWGFLTGCNYLQKGEVINATSAWAVAKLNYDFVGYIGNINKIKAAGFSKFMKEKGISEAKELEYGISRYLFNSGSFHYPIIHPHKVKRLASTGEYTRSFETGVFTNRTDKRTLMNYAKLVGRRKARAEIAKKYGESMV